MQSHLRGGQREAFKELAHRTVRQVSPKSAGQVDTLAAQVGHSRDSPGAASLVLLETSFSALMAFA